MNNTWEEYVSFWQRGRFVKLTTEELRPAFPHLSNLDFKSISSCKVVTLALPPIKVRGSVRVVVLNCAGHEYQLQWISNTNRITNLPFALEAMVYAEEAWPEQLVEDTWADVQNIQLYDPTHLDPLERPMLVTTLYVTLLERWKEIETNVIQPLYQHWNNAIQHITADPIEGGEYAGWQHNTHIRHNCSLCGGGLETNACSGCGFSYKAMGNGWRTPLAPQLVEFLQSRHHSFTLDPSRLWT